MHDETGWEVVSFAERESDLAPMPVLDAGGGRLVARRRRPGDEAPAQRRPGRYEDGWLHVRSGGRYVRRDDVEDLETGDACHEYAALADGRTWLRSVAEWNEEVGGRRRFEPAGA